MNTDISCGTATLMNTSPRCDIENISLFSLSEETSYLDNLSEVAKQKFIDIAFRVLTQKKGNQTTAFLVLQHFNQIKTFGPNNSYIRYIGPQLKDGPISLERIGVTTIPILPPKELQETQEEFLNTLHSFPEYLRHLDNPDQTPDGNKLIYVLGGFAALGNPASFHNPLVRHLREKARQRAINLIFKPLFERKLNTQERNETKLEVLFDRMMIRYKGQAPGADPWHRDVIPEHLIQDTDEIYGGWINLDSRDQYFRCIPGSHLGIRLRDLRSGFATVPKDQIPLMQENVETITVPPGHLIIFPQYILHDVVSKKAKHDMLRLFTGWRTTLSDQPLFDLESKLEDQAVMPLPSGQIPPMWGKLHKVNWINREFRPTPNMEPVSLVTWSQNTFPREIRDSEGIVPRFMKSLREMEMELYKPYTDREKEIYTPMKI